MASLHKFTVWQLVTHRFASTAFSGEGAKLYGGRWNKKGIPMVYTAATQSLAMLEMLVQDEPLRAHYVMIPAYIPEQLAMTRLDLSEVPIKQAALKEVGSLWIKNKTTAILAVPSAVIPTEMNYLLNPIHPDFHKIGIGEPTSFLTDPRLLPQR